MKEPMCGWSVEHPKSDTSWNAAKAAEAAEEERRLCETIEKLERSLDHAQRHRSSAYAAIDDEIDIAYERGYKDGQAACQG